MGRNSKKQHYVPQFLLRKFANPPGSESINVLEIDSGKVKFRRGIKKVAQASYFYGEQAVEDTLGKLESPAGATIAEILRSGLAPVKGTTKYDELLQFIILQSSRTPSSAEDASARLDQIAKAKFAATPELHEFHGRLDDFKVVPNNAPAWAISMAIYSCPLLFDLNAMLLFNTSSVPFVLADHPAVRPTFRGLV